MESEKDKARGIANNPTLPYLLGCGCLGLILFAIALTIVMALIPTYLPSKADGLSRTNYTSMIAQMQAEAGNPTPSGGKRQASVDLNDYIGAEFGAAGREQVRQVIRRYLNYPSVQDVSILSVTVANRADSKKKLMALDRDARLVNTIIYDIKMMFTFDQACPYFCQTKAGSILRQNLYSIPPSAFTFYGVSLYLNGIFEVLCNLRSNRISFVSEILSSFSPFLPGTGPATRGSTVAMITAGTG